VRRADMSRENYMALLAQYNPQRVKSFDAILRETILRADEATLDESFQPRISSRLET
jgi:hypothetical protein